jgi:hypothetical protein
LDFDGGSAAGRTKMAEQWIPVRGVSYDSKGRLQIGQLLKDPYQPSTALLEPEEILHYAPFGEFPTVATVQNEDVGPFGGLVTAVVPFMPPRYLSDILHADPVQSYLTGILRARRKLFIVTGLRTAKTISDDIFFFAYKVGQLHHKKDIWVEAFTPSQIVDTVSDLLRLYDGSGPRNDGRWVLISIIFRFLQLKLWAMLTIRPRIDVGANLG